MSTQKKKTTVTLSGMPMHIAAGMAEEWGVSTSHAVAHMVRMSYEFILMAKEVKANKTAMLMFNPDDFAKLLNPPPSNWGGKREGAGNPNWKKDD